MSNSGAGSCSDGDEWYPPYEPLDAIKQEIRLLKFSSRLSTHPLTPISCSLVTVPLQEAPAYSAISYVWGNPDHSRCIKLNDTPAFVLNTAVEALQHVNGAAFLERDEPAYIWVDAACINLESTQERAQQVMMMSDIYSQAAQVLSFLGAPFTGHADIMTSISKAAVSLWEVAGGRRELDELLDFATALPVADHLAGLDKTLLAQFYSSPWFTRLWILQEAALAHTALAFVGETSMPLSDAIIVARALVKVERHSGHFETTRDALSRGLSRCKTLYNLRVWHACKLKLMHEGDCRKGQCYDGFPMTYLLEVMHNHENSEKRDKVYAILGLAHDSVARQLRPDYNSPLRTVYTQATRVAFQQDKSYEVLRWARTCGNKPDEWYRKNNWPTWLPLWQESYDRLQNPSGLPWWTFKAGRDHSTALQETEVTDPVLRCQGILIDHITSTSETILTGSEQEETDEAALSILQSTIESLLPLAQHATKSLHPNTSPLLALATTLAAGAMHTTTTTTLESSLEFALTASNLADITDSSLTRDAKPGQSGHAVKYLYHFKFHSRFRKVFFTHGGYMGLASQHVRDGDVLFVPVGNSVPWILRKEDGHYLFMGVCYAHGVMQGELSGKLGVDDITSKAQWIEIH